MYTIQQSIATLKSRKNALVLAHTYQPGEVQDIADFVGDSYQLSVKASQTTADIIVFCGVLFMAETAAILNPSRTVILAEPTAGCPMADMIKAEDLVDLTNKYPDHVVLCYVNSGADIKALSDICVTSSNAVTIANKIPKDKGIIFVPDKYLGDYVGKQSGHTMVLWNGFCPTHARMKPEMIVEARQKYPGAPILIHPEAPHEVRELADKVLSTGGMCSFVQSDPSDSYVIATEIGILHTLKKQNPLKHFYPLSESVTCPNMRKGSLQTVLNALDGTGGLEIKVPEEIARKARTSLQKMLDMS